MVARVLLALAVPAGALLAACLALPRLAEVPASFAGLKAYAAHIALALALTVSFAFARSRTFFAVLLLGLAYAGVRHYPHETPLFHGITAALPLALAVLAWRRETGVLSEQGLRYGAAVAAAAIAVIAACVMFPRQSYAALHYTLGGAFALAPVGQPALAATALGIAAAGGAWWHRREAAALALGAAMIAFLLAARVAGDAERASVLVATAALILAVAVLQDIFHLAFRDPLTGLMSRRALDEALATLGRRSAVAMVDVDHFKRVNDAYGHDTGDQVLKMVASRLARVRAARAYRYGGEEFALVLAGRDAEDVEETLEALRSDIAGYPFRLRGPARAATGRAGRKRKAQPAKTVKITVSIGYALPDARQAAPEAVLAMADKALYRAKQGGRNAVCRYERKR